MRPWSPRPRRRASRCRVQRRWAERLEGTALWSSSARTRPSPAGARQRLTRGRQERPLRIQDQGDVSLEQRCAGVKKTFSGKTNPLRQRHGHAVGEVDDHRQAHAGQVHRRGGHPRRPVRADRRAVAVRRGQQGEGRHLRPQQGARRRHQGRAPSSSPSTSSRTSRATWRSTRCGSTRTTATTAAAASAVLTGPAFVDKTNVDAVAEVRRQGNAVMSMTQHAEPAVPHRRPPVQDGRPDLRTAPGATVVGAS